MSDERPQDETRREGKEVAREIKDERAPAPTKALEDLDAGEQAADVTGGYPGRMNM